MTKFTSGPWQVGGGEAGGSEHVIYCDDRTGSAVATVIFKPLDITGRSPDERRANARLIAAAPDLHEALKDVIESVVELFPTLAHLEALKRARVTLDRAEGKEG